MPKVTDSVRFYTKKIERCSECPNLRHSWHGLECIQTGHLVVSYRELPAEPHDRTPSWCPLPIYDAWSEDEQSSNQELTSIPHRGE